MSRVKYILSALAFVALGVVVTLLCMGVPKQSPGERMPAAEASESRPAPKQEKKAARKVQKRPSRRPAQAQPAPRLAAPSVPSEETAMSAEDKAAYDTLQEALDSDDYEKLAPLLEKASQSGNREVREKAVEALSWFGRAALSDLTLFMADPDEDIRQDACTAWASALSEVEDAQEKGQYASAALEILQDKNLSDSLIMEINDLSDAQQIDIVMRLIEGPNKTAGEAAREHYEFITGEEYESPEAAEQWLQENPED